MLFPVLVTGLPGIGVANSELDLCIQNASRQFGVASPTVLKSILETESSGHCPQRHALNRDGSYDIGCMGINSRWLPMLRVKFHISETDLYDRCTNIHIGTWIYAKNIQRFGNTWRAVGAYNATSESKRVEYTWKIYQNLAPISSR